MAVLNHRKTMKKISLILTILALAAASAYAQPSETTPEGLTKNPKFRMGVSASGVLSWFNPEGNDEFVDPDGARFSIGYGAHLDFGLGTNRNYYFSTGLFVLNTGGSLKYDFIRDDNDNVVSRSIDYRFNYINIPLTMMLRTNEIGYMVYYARIGLDNGFNIKSTYDSSDATPGGSVVQEDESSPDFASLYRAALHIEGGIEINLTGTTNVFLGLEWNNGLNNVFSKDAKGVKPGNETPTRFKGVSNAVLLNVGVYF